MTTKTKKLPKWHTIKLELAPDQGAAPIATSIVPPDGYMLANMSRRGTKVTVKFVRVDPA